LHTFTIKSGKWVDFTGNLLGIAYSGGECGLVPEAVNNPAYMDKQNVGPIPVGIYRIGAPVDTVTHGPYFLPLTPDPSNRMYGRSGFGVHGDSIVKPGRESASDGCIVGLQRNVRQAIWDGGDHDLQVVTGIVYPDIDGEIAV
jgi:hypothetical protein